MGRFKLLLYVIIFTFINSSANALNMMTLEVQKGDTLSNILRSANITANDASKAVSALSELYSPSKLKVGQKIKIGFEIDDKGDEDISLSLIQIKTSILKNITVKKDGNHFVAKEEENDITTKLVKSKAVVDSTLFQAANDSKIPYEIMMTLIQNYSFDIDFQRDIRKGNSFEVLYEQLYDDEGNLAGAGELIFSSISLNDQTIPIYRYKAADGRIEYFDETGNSVRRSFLKTPVDGARISSGFGRRKHPILGYTKLHKGIDFAASRGTPIYAAGSGTIEKASRFGSYGKYVKIRHNNGYYTAYAHLNSYARGVKKGRKIKQGQVIGYVGSTGRSTGPHLHYEVIKNGRQINPMSIKTASSKKLKSLELGIFSNYINNVDRLFASLDYNPSVRKFAANNTSD